MPGIQIDENILININKLRIDTMTSGLLDALYTDKLMHCFRIRKIIKGSEQRKTFIQAHDTRQ